MSLEFVKVIGALSGARKAYGFPDGSFWTATTTCEITA